MLVKLGCRVSAVLYFIKNDYLFQMTTRSANPTKAFSKQSVSNELGPYWTLCQPIFETAAVELKRTIERFKTG